MLVNERVNEQMNRRADMRASRRVDMRTSYFIPIRGSLEPPCDDVLERQKKKLDRLNENLLIGRALANKTRTC